MCGLVPVTLHILGVSGALSGKGPRGMFWKLFLSCLPLALAAAVAISRTFVLCSVLLVLLHCGVTQNAWQNRAPRVATGHHTSHHHVCPVFVVMMQDGLSPQFLGHQRWHGHRIDFCDSSIPHVLSFTVG